MVTCTLKLGISILNGGNVQVQQVRFSVQSYLLYHSSYSVQPSNIHQHKCLESTVALLLQSRMFNAFPLLSQKMLDYLKEKRDVGFFKSLSGLMQSCRYYTIILSLPLNWFSVLTSGASLLLWVFSPQCLGFERIWEAEQSRRTWHGDRGRFK